MFSRYEGTSCQWAFIFAFSCSICTVRGTVWGYLSTLTLSLCAVKEPVCFFKLFEIRSFMIKKMQIKRSRIGTDCHKPEPILMSS